MHESRARTRLMMLLVSALLGPGLAGASPVRAEKAPAPPSPAPAAEPPMFSFGAGFGFVNEFAGVGLAGLNGLSSVNSASRVPFGTALFEVAISLRLRLVIGATGSYAKPTRGGGDDSGAADKVWTLGGTVGLRWVLNPGGVVEVSPLLSCGSAGVAFEDQRTGSFADADGELQYLHTDSKSLAYDGRLGLVLEHALLANLFLRFESYFVRVGYAKTQTREEQRDLTYEKHTRADVFAGFGIAPQLQLRLTF